MIWRRVPRALLVAFFHRTFFFPVRKRSPSTSSAPGSAELSHKEIAVLKALDHPHILRSMAGSSWGMWEASCLGELRMKRTTYCTGFVMFCLFERLKEWVFDSKF